jgi:hypothetical protein
LPSTSYRLLELGDLLSGYSAPVEVIASPSRRKRENQVLQGEATRVGPNYPGFGKVYVNCEYALT